MNKDKQKELEKELLTLFLFILNYSKKINPLLINYRKYRDELTNEVNKIYVKYTKDNEFNIAINDVKKELKKIEPIIKKIGRELYKEENELLSVILNQVCKDTYSKTYGILNKDIKDLKNISKEEIESITTKYKIKGKTNLIRNKDNKTIFINKVNRDIKKALANSESIEVTNKIIDDVFGNGAYISKRLIENEISRVFNKTILKVYKENNIEKVKFVAVMDNRTSEICSNLDGFIFPIDNSPIPPLHLNCRSCLIAET